MKKAHCKTEEELKGVIHKDYDAAKAFLKKSELLKDFNLETEDEQHAEEIRTVLERNRFKREWWAFLLCIFARAWLERDGEDDEEIPHHVLLWNLAKARALFLMGGEVEELAWRGYQTYGIESLKRCLQVWDERTPEQSKNEEFWQALIQDNPLLVGMIFVGPIVVEENKAYMGGKKIDNTGGRVVDFLLRYSVGGNAALLEIKTPGDRLLGAEYRNGIYRISGNLTGAIVQVSSYKDSLLKQFHVISQERDLVAFDPTCIVLAGNYLDEVGADEGKRRSFELFRQTQSGVLIVTYDELFERVRNFLNSLAGR